MTPMPDGQTILGVFPALNEGNNTDFYNTMVQMNVTHPDTVSPGKSPPFKRLGNGRLFYANEVYVSWCLIKRKLYHAGIPELSFSDDISRYASLEILSVTQLSDSPPFPVRHFRTRSKSRWLPLPIRLRRDRYKAGKDTKHANNHC